MYTRMVGDFLDPTTSIVTISTPSWAARGESASSSCFSLLLSTSSLSFPSAAPSPAFMSRSARPSRHPHPISSLQQRKRDKPTFQQDRKYGARVAGRLRACFVHYSIFPENLPTTPPGISQVLHMRGRRCPYGDRKMREAGPTCRQPEARSGRSRSRRFRSRDPLRPKYRPRAKAPINHRDSLDSEGPRHGRRPSP